MRCVYAKIYFVEKIVLSFISDFEVCNGGFKTSKIYPDFSGFQLTSHHNENYFYFLAFINEKKTIKYGNYNQCFKTF